MIVAVAVGRVMVVVQVGVIVVVATAVITSSPAATDLLTVHARELCGARIRCGVLVVVVGGCG